MTAFIRPLFMAMALSATADTVHAALPKVIETDLLNYQHVQTPVQKACSRPKELISSGNNYYYRPDEFLPVFKIHADDYVTLTFIKLGIAPSFDTVTYIPCVG